MRARDTEPGGTSGAVHAAPVLDERLKVEVRLQLERILRSPAFRGSKRCQDFLQYVVDHSLSGDIDRLKGRTIGVDVLGRDPEYDSSEDAIVRVKANELRKRLAQYYVETGHSEELRIEIPPGSYVPEFHPVGPVETVLPPAVDVPQPSVFRRRRWLLAVAVVAVAIPVTAFVRWFGSPASSPLDQFWAPVLASRRPVLICSGHPVVYFLSRRVHERYRQQHRVDPASGPYVIELDPSETVEGRDIVPVRDQYVGVGDAMAAAMLHGLFARKDKPAQIRFGNDISFSDLRNSPAVLIGAYSNRWTLQMTDRLRFVFVLVDGVKAVEDRSVKGRRWALPNIAPDGKTPEDYAIVSRVFDSQTGELLISAAGITQYGTRAAGEFLTSEALMAAAVAQASPDWYNRNFQAVLRTRIVGETPGQPEVVATHYW